MIEIRDLTKRFGKLEVLRGVNLEIESGSVTAILGPNAAGKTTLIKSILGLTKPDGGSILVNGHRLNGDWSYRSEIGYMPQRARFPENLTGRDIIRLVVRLRNGRHDDVSEYLKTFGVEPELDKKIRTLSGGTRQKLSAVIALLFNAGVLILDEPTAGLDPVASSRLKDLILSYRRDGRTVILTSHIISEVEEMADRVVFLQEGRVLFAGAVSEIRQKTGQRRLERAIAHLMSGVAA
jgi:Cu-processing system ATP-binding protein